MDESRQHAVQFLEKEIKTYLALSSFLSKMGVKGHVIVDGKKVATAPLFYSDRMKEAKKLVYELKKPA